MKNKSGAGLAADILGPMTADDPMMLDDDMLGDPMQMAASEILSAIKQGDPTMLAEALRAAIQSAQFAEDED